MEQKGFTSAPMLQVNDEIYDFINAIKWLTERRQIINWTYHSNYTSLYVC
jgi:hypothetical protein